MWVLVGRAGGFLVPFLIAFLLGASSETDAFFFAYALILSLLNIFAHIFESALVPFIVEQKENSEQPAPFILKALILSLPVIFILSIAVASILPPLLNLSSTMNAQTVQLVSRLYREMLPGLFAAIFVSVYHGLFYASKNFWFPSASTLVRTFVMIIFFIFGKQKLGIHALTWGFVFGEILRWSAAHMVWSKEVKDRLSLKGEGFKQVFYFFQQAFFQIAALIALNILPLMDQWFATSQGPGMNSLFNYADKLLQVPYLLFFYGFTQVFFSFWSESHIKEGPALFFEKVEKDMKVVFAGALVLVAILWLAAHPLMRLFFIFSHLTEEQIISLTEIFRWLALGFLPGIMRILYGRILMIIRKSKFYFFQAWVELFIKILFNLFFVTLFGVAGLAMATALVYSVTTVWFYFYLKNERRKAFYEKGAL